jgi:hypothetical protein
MYHVPQVRIVLAEFFGMDSGVEILEDGNKTFARSFDLSAAKAKLAERGDSLDPTTRTWVQVHTHTHTERERERQRDRDRLTDT